MTCADYRQLISGFVDGELDAGLVRDVRCHLEHCTECSRYHGGLMKLPKIVVPDPPGGEVRAPATLWPKIAAEIQREAAPAATREPARSVLRAVGPWLVATAALLMVSVLPAYWLTRQGGAGPTIGPTDESVEVPRGLALATYVREMQDANQNAPSFLDLHQGREVPPGDLSQHVDFATRLPSEPPPGFDFGKCYVLATASGNAIGCEYVQGSRRITIFEQPEGGPLPFENLAQGCMDMNGVHCRCVMINGITVLNWSDGGRTVTVVCNSDAPGIGTIIDSLLSDE